MSALPTLVILPGWGGSHETWRDFIDVAGKHFTVVCIDLPCFGDEPCPDNIWGVEDYVNFVKSKIIPIKSGQKSKIILLGHSFGGQVAVCLAAKHPDLIDKLILSGAAVIRPKNFSKRFFFGLVAKTGKLFFRLPFIERFDVFAKKILYRGADSPDYSKTSGIKRDIYKKIIRQDFTQLLPNLIMPTLVTWGNHDKMTPLEHGKKISQLIPNSTLKVLPGGHGLHIDITEEYLSVIIDFVYGD